VPPIARHRGPVTPASRPPTTELNHLVTEIADPASVQHCTTYRDRAQGRHPGSIRSGLGVLTRDMDPAPIMAQAMPIVDRNVSGRCHRSRGFRSWPSTPTVNGRAALPRMPASHLLGLLAANDHLGRRRGGVLLAAGSSTGCPRQTGFEKAGDGSR